MDATIEGIASAIAQRISTADRPHVMMRVGPVIKGARLVEIGRAGWWQGAILAEGAGPVEIAQTATLLVRGLAQRPVPLPVAEVA